MEIDDVNPNEQGNNVPAIDTVEGEKDPVEIEKDQGSKVHLVNPIEEGGGDSDQVENDHKMKNDDVEMGEFKTDEQGNNDPEKDPVEMGNGQEINKGDADIAEVNPKEQRNEVPDVEKDEVNPDEPSNGDPAVNTVEVEKDPNWMESENGMKNYDVEMEKQNPKEQGNNVPAVNPIGEDVEVIAGKSLM